MQQILYVFHLFLKSWTLYIPFLLLKILVTFIKVKVNWQYQTEKRTQFFFISGKKWFSKNVEKVFWYLLTQKNFKKVFEKLFQSVNLFPDCIRIKNSPKNPSYELFREAFFKCFRKIIFFVINQLPLFWKHFIKTLDMKNKKKNSRAIFSNLYTFLNIFGSFGVRFDLRRKKNSKNWNIVTFVEYVQKSLLIIFYDEYFSNILIIRNIFINYLGNMTKFDNMSKTSKKNSSSFGTFLTSDS